jgi:hypothetical protein
MYLLAEDVKFAFDVVSFFNEQGIQGLQTYYNKIKKYA